MHILITILINISILFALEVNLSNKEKHFIQSHIFKCANTGEWPPLNYEENGKIVGISIEYWNIIKESLHLKTECVITHSWPKVFKLIKEKKADLTIATSNTPEREKYALFSKAYDSFPISIVTRRDTEFIPAMAFLKGKIIVTGRDYTAGKLLKKQYPYLNIMEVKNIETALEMVSNKEAFAAIDIMPVLVYYLNKKKFSNLKIAGDTPLKFELKIMVRKDYPLLVSAINKVIEKITPTTRELVYQKWVYKNINQKQGIPLKNAIFYILLTTIITTILTFIILKQSKKKTQFVPISHIEKLTTKKLTIASINVTDEKLLDNLGNFPISKLSPNEYIIALPKHSIKDAIKILSKIKNAKIGIATLRKKDSFETLIIRANSLMQKANPILTDIDIKAD